jgi:ABC-type Fe3+/spermidine/putrescine transport system ATPase subunit
MTGKLATILEIQNLCSSYEDSPLLQHINLTLHHGEILCLLGPSGSGKTTLLKLIAGLEEGDAGKILFRGENIAGIPPHKRKIGMMFQEYALFPHKNVYENIAFGLEMQHCATDEKRRRIFDVLKLVDLNGFESRRIDELSGGERQRVALARSLAPEPQLLLLDEPLGSLDRAMRDRLTGEIRTILKSLGVSAVFVTHDQAEAFSIADKVAILHEGRLEQVETPENIYRYPLNLTVARFLGFTNIIRGSCDANGLFHSSVGSLQLKNSALQQQNRSLLLIRPDGARLCQNIDSGMHYNEIQGEVCLRQFLGNRYKVTVLCDENQLSFDLPLDPEPPQSGEEINLQISASALVQLKNTEKYEE